MKTVIQRIIQHLRNERFLSRQTPFHIPTDVFRGQKRKLPVAAPAVTVTPPTARVKRNWQIYSLYSRGDHDECLRVIEQQLVECRGQ